MVPLPASMIAMPPHPAEPSNAWFHVGSMTAMPPSCSSEPSNACPALLIPPVQSYAWWWWYTGTVVVYYSLYNLCIVLCKYRLIVLFHSLNNIFCIVLSTSTSIAHR